MISVLPIAKVTPSFDTFPSIMGIFLVPWNTNTSVVLPHGFFLTFPLLGALLSPAFTLKLLMALSSQILLELPLFSE